MSLRHVHRQPGFLGALSLALALLLPGALSGCASAQRPSLKVVAVEQAAAKKVLLVQVTNPESRPIRLQRLQYTFAGANHSAPVQGEVLLSRDIPVGAAVIVEVPVDHQLAGDGPFTLEGNLEALIDRIVRVYPVATKVDPATTKIEARTEAMPPAAAQPQAAPAPMPEPALAPAQ